MRREEDKQIIEIIQISIGLNKFKNMQSSSHHQQKLKSPPQQLPHQVANANTQPRTSINYNQMNIMIVPGPTSAAYGFTQNQSARHSAVSGTTTHSGSNRSNERGGAGMIAEQTSITATPSHQQLASAYQYAGNSASNNYYYSQGSVGALQMNASGGYHPTDFAHPSQITSNQSYHTNSTPGSAQVSSSKIKVSPYSIQPEIPQQKVANTISQHHNLNAVAALQAYQHQTQGKHTTTVQSRKASDPMSPNYNSNPNNAGIVAQLYQQQVSSQKKNSGYSSQTGSGKIGQQRHESLQNNINNKRRVQQSTNLLGSSSSQLNAGKQISQTSTDVLKFNQTQKIVPSAFASVGSASSSSQNGLLTGTIGGGPNKKSLKLSIDQHSDSSFNNVSIKSADKHNSVVRTAAGIISGKLTGQINGLNVKDISNQISPSSYNGGGSIIQNLTSSQNSVYSSHFSNNSRFTNTRPKNPTDSSSLSSKNSDSLSATGTKNILHDIKKTAAQKLANKQATIQTIKEQHQMLIQQHQQSDSMSDTGEGSFNSNHENNLQQKPLSTKAYTNITGKGQSSDKVQSVVAPIQIKTSNSIANLTKISSQINIATTSQHHAQQQSTLNQGNSYKSKFNLLNRPLDIGSITKDQKKLIQGALLQGAQSSSQSNVVQGTSGGDSYRRNSEFNQQQRSIPQQPKQQANCGAPFSPKQNTNTAGHSKISATKQTALLLAGAAQTVSQRNHGLQTKTDGSKSGTVGSVGSSNHAKKSNRDSHRGNSNRPIQQQINQEYQNQYESNMNYVKPQAQQQIMIQGKNQNDYVGSNPKFNLDQLQNALKQQQIQHKVMASETIQEERFEDSEQNTKRESTQQNIKQQSTANLHHDNQSQSHLSQVMPAKSKSLLTINLESTENLKKMLNEQALKQAQQHQNITETQQSIGNAHSQIISPASALQVEEIKSNSNLQALKEQLKSQIAKQHHPFSNPNQPSSQIEAEEIQYPISSHKALKVFSNYLNEYEKYEILEYNEIYFLGLNAQKIVGNPDSEFNYGYDDDRGDYQVVLKDHLCYRYEVQEFLGKGSFGQALKCFDYKTNEHVAVKIIRNKKRFHHQAGVELNILTYLRDNDPEDVNNIIRIKDYAIFRKHLIISFELLSINLYEFIKNNNFSGVSLGLIRRFAIQILQALKYQRDHGIIHCDLKPENILLKQPNKSGIKIIDYGSSCFQNQRIYTYIQSRFYRAPEIILGIPYTTSIDMWSFGCILAELYTGYPLFPGENEMDQLAFIMQIKGVPDEYLLELSSRKKLFFDGESQPIIVANSKGKKRLPNTKTLRQVLKCQDEKFLEFIDSCLNWDPVDRLTPLEALRHEWILEGLPTKVLQHHKRMFDQIDDKNNIKMATLTQIQGFPRDYEEQSIFNKLKQGKLQAVSNKAVEQQRQRIIEEEKKQEVVLSPEQDQPPFASKKSNNTPQVAQPQDTQRSNQGSNANGVQPKKNKTISHFVQELLEEKAQQQQIQAHPPVPKTVEKKKDSSIDMKKRQVDPQIFYNPIVLKSNQIQNFKNQTMSLNKIKELDSQYVGSSMPNEVPDEDMEEGVHFNKTQKIPISLIKQQEKIPTHHQVPFYNPKVSGPKLNNYVSQAAAFSKKTHSSTTNLANKAQYQMQNYSATLTAQQMNSSLNHPQNVCSMSNFNIMPSGGVYPTEPCVMGSQIPVSSRSNNKLLNQSSQSSQQHQQNVLLPQSIQINQNFLIGSTQRSGGGLNSGGPLPNSKNQYQTTNPPQAIKIDLSSNSLGGAGAHSNGLSPENGGMPSQNQQLFSALPQSHR